MGSVISREEEEKPELSVSGACTKEGHVRTQQSGLDQTLNQTQPPKLREINASSLNHPACGTLSQQPELTHHASSGKSYGFSAPPFPDDNQSTALLGERN